MNATIFFMLIDDCLLDQAGSRFDCRLYKYNDENLTWCTCEICGQKHEFIMSREMVYKYLMGYSSGHQCSDHRNKMNALKNFEQSCHKYCDGGNYFHVDCMVYRNDRQITYCGCGRGDLVVFEIRYPSTDVWKFTNDISKYFFQSNNQITISSTCGDGCSYPETECMELKSHKKRHVIIEGSYEGNTPSYSSANDTHVLNMMKNNKTYLQTTTTLMDDQIINDHSRDVKVNQIVPTPISTLISNSIVQVVKDMDSNTLTTAETYFTNSKELDYDFEDTKKFIGMRYTTTITPSLIVSDNSKNEQNISDIRSVKSVQITRTTSNPKKTHLRNVRSNRSKRKLVLQKKNAATSKSMTNSAYELFTTSSSFNNKGLNNNSLSISSEEQNSTIPSLSQTNYILADELVKKKQRKNEDQNLAVQTNSFETSKIKKSSSYLTVLDKLKKPDLSHEYIFDLDNLVLFFPGDSHSAKTDDQLRSDQWQNLNNQKMHAGEIDIEKDDFTGLDSFKKNHPFMCCGIFKNLLIMLLIITLISFIAWLIRKWLLHRNYKLIKTVDYFL